MGSPAAGWAAGLAATWAASLAALLAEGLARGLAAWGLAAGSSPCGNQLASGTSRSKYNFLLAKLFANPNTPHAPFAHTISVFDALSHFLATAKHIFFVTMTCLFLHATIHARYFRSISWYLVFLPNPWLKLRKSEVFCMIQGTVDARNLKYTTMHQ